MNIKNTIFIFLLLIFSCNENPLSTNSEPICHNPSWIIDDCGNCRECNSSTCLWNDMMDECGICYGDDDSCTGCTSELASNYDINAIISCNDCCIYSNLFIEFTDEEGFSPSLHQTVTGVPIYWLNSSSHDIIIETINSSQPNCTQDENSFYVNTECSSYNNEEECTILHDGCTWNIPLSYNQDWDNLYLEIPADTNLNSAIQYFFIGFDNPAGYQYFYINETNNIEYYGFINATRN